MSEPRKSKKRSALRQRGYMLVESLVAVTIVGTGILAAVTSLSTSSLAVVEARENATAAWLGTSQVELIKASTFVAAPGVYPTVVPPADYTIQNSTAALPGGDGFIQDVTIEIFRGGETITTIVMVKINN